MSYLSPLLTQIVNLVRKSTHSLDRDFNEIEKLQSSVCNYQAFASKSHDKVLSVLKDELSRIKPDAAIITDSKLITKSPCFLINPIDGLINYVRGIPQFATTVAYIENGDVKNCVVYNRASDDLYFAEKGHGAFKEGFRNHERLRVSQVKDAPQSMVSAQIGYDYGTTDYDSAVSRVFNAPNVRMHGCGSLSLAYVASGKYDVNLSLGSVSASSIAGLLLVKEAGGYVYDFGAKSVVPQKLDQVLACKNVAASNNAIGAFVAKLAK